MNLVNQKSNYNFIPLSGYEHFEATTQIIIEEVIRRGLTFEIIDKDNNLIAVTYQGKEFIIHEGTISDANSLIAYWISNDKWMTKQFLLRHGINHAKGVLLHQGYQRSSLKELSFPLVVKPVDTDHGIGVSTNICNDDDLVHAIEESFNFSGKAIVEEYFVGREYRFLVIDDTVRAVAFREPANVVGNGHDSIMQLIEEKNRDRGDDYTHPLLKIKVDDEVERHLKAKLLNVNSVIPKGEKVFLRNNSNLSTGGDSIDVTDEIPGFYKDVAVQASRAAGLKLAGVDIIINDTNALSQNSYIVVELNAPAMLSMHNYPYIGKNRHVEKHVLDCIFKQGF